MEEKILEKIYNAGLKFLMPLNAQETYELIVKEAMKLVRAELGSIYIYENDELKKVYASSPLLYRIKPRKNGITYSVFKTKKPRILTHEVIEDIHPEIQETLARSDIILPLAYKNKSVGVLTVMSVKNNFFTERELEILKLFVPLASLAVRKTQLYDETRQALESRDLFISMAAHELRTPLTAINGYAQMLYSKLSKTNTRESGWAEQLYYECIRLNNLINDLLEINKIRTGQFVYDFKECSLEDIIKRAINNIKFVYPSREFIFRDTNEEKDVYIIGDFDKILQSMVGIIENAAKFSSSEKEVVITLETDAKNAIIKVRDFGVGIDKKDIPKIFENYFVGKNHDKEGMGLGLFLAKNAFHRHRGSVTINSNKGKGTTVTMKLPIARYE
jgi:two-component system, sensor histidine kinase